MQVAPVLTLFLILGNISASAALQTHCAFCDETVVNRQKFYEDDLVIGLFSYKPISTGHMLVIPKRHVERYEELSEEEVISIHRLLRKVHTASKKVFNADAYLLLQKNGANVGQTVPHVHFHYIPRRKDETSQIGFIMRFYAQFWQRPIGEEELKTLTGRMKIGMKEHSPQLVYSSEIAKD